MYVDNRHYSTTKSIGIPKWTYLLMGYTFNKIEEYCKTNLFNNFTNSNEEYINRNDIKENLDDVYKKIMQCI